jgi:hypothetical protein
MKHQKWSEEETGRLLDLMKTHGRDFKTIGRLLGRTPQSAEHRWRWVTMPEDQIQERVRKDKIRQAAIRAAAKGKHGAPISKMEVPHDVIIERELRLAAPMSVSAFVLGDPPTGFSALDRKLAEVRA